MKIKTLLIFLSIFPFILHGQTKVITGPKHVISFRIPENWIQVPSRQLPLLLKPDANVSANTFMYVQAIDYDSPPDIDKWVQEDIDGFTGKHPDATVQLMQVNLVNLSSNGYQTGRYKIILYTCDDGRKEAVLVIECKNTITSILLSTVGNDEFSKYEPAFLQAVSSARVLPRNARN